MNKYYQDVLFMNGSISRSLQLRDDGVAVQGNDSPGHPPGPAAPGTQCRGTAGWPSVS